MGKADEAQRQFREAVRLDPQNAGAHYNIAMIARARGDMPEAIARLREAVRLQPDWMQAVAQLAWILATTSSASLRDAGQAIRLAEHAAALTSRRTPACWMSWLRRRRLRAISTGGHQLRRSAGAETRRAAGPPSNSAARFTASIEPTSRHRDRLPGSHPGHPREAVEIVVAAVSALAGIYEGPGSRPRQPRVARSCTEAGTCRRRLGDAGSPDLSTPLVPQGCDGVRRCTRPEPAPRSLPPRPRTWPRRSRSSTDSGRIDR